MFVETKSLSARTFRSGGLDIAKAVEQLLLHTFQVDPAPREALIIARFYGADSGQEAGVLDEVRRQLRTHYPAVLSEKRHLYEMKHHVPSHAAEISPELWVRVVFEEGSQGRGARKTVLLDPRNDWAEVRHVGAAGVEGEGEGEGPLPMTLMARSEVRES